MIAVVGNVPDLPSDLRAVPIPLVGEPPRGAFAATIFDLRAAPVVDLITIRDHLGLSDLPLLLVSDSTIPESVISLLRADDAFVIGEASPAAFARRVGVFVELGRSRRGEAERQRFERLAAMGTMVAGFAHEVRNPVAALRSLCEELRDEGVTLPHVPMMLQMVERIERLVRTSLQFGRPAAPKRSPRRPAMIASSAISELRPRLAHDPILIDAEPELPDVYVDERQISQALVILLNNALDATGGSPDRVQLRVRKSAPAPPVSALPPTIRFEVIDDGPGISPAHLGRIFDPFFTTKTSGTGLGLSIAQQIVHENGARLEVDSTPGGPTSFCIILPTHSTADSNNKDFRPALFRS